MIMEKEKVIIIGLDSVGEKIITCQVFTTEKQLQDTMLKRFDCADFLTIYPEDIPSLEDAINELYGEN